MSFIYLTKYNRKLGITDAFVCESFRNQLADRVLATASVQIFSYFVTFLSILLLNAVRPANENPERAATLASGGLAIMPKPVWAVANPAEDKPAARKPRPTAEPWTMECVRLYFFATCL